MRPGEELSAQVELGAGARLVVGGCIGRPASRGEAGAAEGGRLEVAVEPRTRGEALVAPVALPAYTDAFRQELDLGRLGEGPVRLVLRAHLAAGRELFLREVVVRHRVHRARAREPQPRKTQPHETQPHQTRPRPTQQILLISVDTLRADGLSALGGPWPTPALDRLASRAQLFAPHYAAAPWTKPSHASLLTGQSPRLHGAEGFEAPVSPAVPLLAERFAAAGLLTKGLVYDCVWLNPQFGFDRGFAEYHSTHWTLPQMVRQAVDWIGDHREDPFFFFFHTFEPHSDWRWLPYEAPEVRRKAVDERFGVVHYGFREGQRASGLLTRIREGKIAPIPGEQAILRYLYGEGVRHVDRELGVLFADLEELGVFDGMLIVLTADHGEALLDHGETLHGSPWGEVAKVPLLIKWPGGRAAGERYREPTSALDVAPTLLAAAGLPAEGLPGRDLGRRDGPRPVFSWGGLWRTVVQGGWKAVLRPEGELLFDLGADPSEERNLAAERPQVLGELRRLAEARAELDRRLAAVLGRPEGAEPPAPLTPEELERLRALGYVGAP